MEEENNTPAQETIDLSLIASIAQLFLLVMMVIYSDSKYDLWDLAIAGLVIYLWRVYGASFTLGKFEIASVIARFGVSVAIMVWIMSAFVYLIPLLSPTAKSFFETLQSSNYQEMILSLIEICLTALIFPFTPHILGTKKKAE